MSVAFRELCRAVLMRWRIAYLRGIWGHPVARTARISFSAYLDRANPAGTVVGDYTIVTRGAVILSHDFTRSVNCVTRIGGNCLIGVNAIICPGVQVGDEVVVGAGAVVTRDVPSNTIVAGNPAQVVGRIRAGKYGAILERLPASSGT